MAETLEKNLPPLAEALTPAEQSYQLATDQLAQNLPELQEKREAIDTASSEIIQSLDIRPEFFEDDGRAITFTAIAERWSRLDSEDTALGEKEFLHDSLALLVREFSPSLSEAKKQIDGEDSALSEKGQLAVYDKYTDKELSAAAREGINSKGLLDGVKDRLGITTENEDAYEVRVLSLASSDNESYGLSVPSLDNDNLPEDRTERNALLAQDDQTRQLVRGQNNGLVVRGEKMANELGRDGLFAPAWVTKLDGKTLLCIAMPLAEKILSPELTKDNKNYDEDSAARDFAILEHEYTHTQGGVDVDRELNFGINLEELRAEHFSGNKQGYQDIKGFMIDYSTVTGKHPEDLFNGLEKGGSVADIFGAIANEVGLKRMLEVVMVSPKNYMEAQSNEFSRNAYKHLGGFDGVISRLIEDKITAGKGAELEENITKRAKRMAEIAGKPGNDWLWDQRRTHGLNAMTSLVNKKAEELGLKQVA